MEISKRLKCARESKSITQEELADKLGVTRQTISSWENGKSYPDIVSIIKISDIFDISLDKLLKEDKNLITNMKKRMDTVESNKYIIFTILFAVILFGGMYLLKTFVNIPKIDNLFSNIILLSTFIIGTITYIFSNIHVSKFLNQKTSNKSILKTIIVMISIVLLFIIFPITDKLEQNVYAILLIRTNILLVIILLCMFIFKKIDKC